MSAPFLEGGFQTPAFHKIKDHLLSSLCLIRGKQGLWRTLALRIAREHPADRQRIRAIAILFSACCLGLIHTPEPPPTAFEQRKSIWSDLVEGLRLVRKMPALPALAGSAGTFSLFGNFIGALYAL